MEHEPIDDFERELTQALARRPAPPSLKRRLMERRRFQRSPKPGVVWQRLAASLLIVAALASGFAWHQREEQRKGEAAREQVFTALRVTNRALNHVQTQLAAHSRNPQD